MPKPAARTVALAGLLLLAACGSGGTTDSAGTVAGATVAPGTAAPGTAAPGTSSQAPDAQPPSSDVPAPATSLAPGPVPTVPPILDVSAETVSDGPLSLAAYAGRPVALWFWAPG